MHHPQASMYKAAFMTLIQGDSVDDFGLLLRTVRDLEDSFNHAHGYPFVIFSVDPLSTRAKELVASLTSGTVHFETLHGQQQFYGYGPETQLGKAVKARHQLKDQVDEGDSKTFRFNARFMAGTLYQHPALKELDYIWRFQPGTHYPCPIFEEEQATKDPFYYMYKHQKKLSFSLTVREPIQAAPTLFQTVTDYINKHPAIQSRLTQRDSLWPLVASKEDGQYTQCEFSSSFQIADLSFFRSDQYQSFFDHIDKANGIFYERCDSAIQSMGAALFLKKQDIHRWEDVGYRGLGGLLYCPTNPDLWSRCDCRPEYNFDDSRTCLAFLA
ncbi:alpha--mannosyltransferase [Lichtheimia corymbifera JMRC:FSU:9682]|uniref:Alpha--mannosyltransferase n=1 Tax=Lichtheimia corymbifera JMRC:FSU:9682 TaxID=1263082 RepID=A0A068RYC3_9FUNG|nr:alpha--mannosyltransferase [Lichtheimia corymbifera JMRC:FSU:9682]